MSAHYPKRLIEVDLPIRRISEHARRDQNVRKGHLHTMHVWWATRPLASCRAVICATLWPDPADKNCPQQFREDAYRVLSKLKEDVLHGLLSEDQRSAREPVLRIRLPEDEKDLEGLRQALLDFIAEFANWDLSTNRFFLETARALTASAHEALSGTAGSRPLVVDPFAGAGSIPFEALRVGADAYASDLNPIPVLLNKVALEYLPKYGNQLAEGVKKWGNWLLEEARKKLAPYYPADSKGHIPLAYIWARTITCEGPGCGAEVPLLGMLWLSKKAKNHVALRYHGDPKTKRVEVDIFRPRSAKEVQPGIVNRMSTTCPCCGYTTPYKSVRGQLRKRRGGTNDARLIAVITLDQNGGRYYRLPTDADRQAAEKAERDVAKLEQNHQGPWSFVPTEPHLNAGRRWINTPGWGFAQWRDMYLPRQALALGTFCQLVGETRDEMIKAGRAPGFADAVATCVTLAISNLSHYLSSISIWASDGMISAFLQGSGLAMRPDFAEANPLMPRLVGGVEYALGLVNDFLAREAAAFHLLAGRHGRTGTAQRGSATHIPLPDDSVAYVVTDPPYYDAVGYSHLSDFVYVWLKRALGGMHRDLFASELTPKGGECILDPGPPAEGGISKDREYFEATMQAALADARRVLRPDGVCVVIFAHKGTAGWEALLSALVNAGWTVTGSWPIDTERAARMRAKDSAVLGSSVHLVCRPRENPDGSLRRDVGDWRDVLRLLPERIHEWLPRLAKEGVVGADAVFACLGPALEVFSRYDRVEKASGEEVTLREYLEHVWAAVSREALGMVFEGADTMGFEEDARLTAMWLWTLKTAANGNGKDAEKLAHSGGFALEYDAARKIAQGLGAHLDELKSLVEVKGDTARLLRVAERTGYLFGKDEAQAPKGRRRKKTQQASLFAELDLAEKEEGGWGEKSAPRAGETVLDRVHQAMILFAVGRSGALKRFLVDDGAGEDQRFWRLAQAFSALYPSATDEKRWVDGVLARKKGLGL